MNKLTKILLTLVFLLSTTTFSVENVEVDGFVTVNGITFVKGEKTPYSGMITHEKDRSFYYKGKPDGKWLTFYPNGNLKSITNWKNGILHGKYIQYQENGKKILENSYYKGVDNGRYLIFHANGVPNIEGSFNRGKADGRWIYRDVNGKVTKINEF